MIPTGRARAAALWITYTALSLYFTLPLLASGSRLGIGDWDVILFQYASVFRSVYEYGAPPYWNPWYCGGNVLWQNPQTALLSLVYPLALIVPLATAMKVTIVAHYLVGFAGMHLLLTRGMRVSSYPLLVFLSSLFVLAGGIALRLVVGHSAYLPYFYLPWLLLLWVRAIESRSAGAIFGAAAILALSLYEGGFEIVFLTALSLACFSIAAAVCLRRIWPLAVLATAGVLAALLAGPKLVPMMMFVLDPEVIDNRSFHRPDRMTLQMVLHAFTDPFQFPRMILRDQKYGWHEYGNYLGVLGAPLILASLAWVASRRHDVRRAWLGISLAVTVVVLFALMLGEAGAFAPYELLSRLPLLSRIRLPSRYTVTLLIFATMLVAWVVREASEQSAIAAPLRRLIVLVLVIGTASLVYYNRMHFGGAFPYAPLQGEFRFLSRPPAPTIDTVPDGLGPDSPVLRAMMQNRSVLRCYDALLLPGKVYPSQPIVFGDGATRVSRVEFGPNRIRFGVVTGDQPGRVTFNSRYLDGWRSNTGALERDATTDVTFLTVPPMTAQRIELRFRPKGLWAGVLMFIAGLAAGVMIWLRARARRKRSAAAQPSVSSRLAPSTS